MFEISEKRKDVRRVKPYIVSFRAKPDETLNIVSKGWDMVTVNNFSAGGAFFYAENNLGVGTILDLKIGFSRSHPSLICVGKVVRMKRRLGTSTFGFAIKFTEVDDQAKIIIDNTVDKIKTHILQFIKRSKPTLTSFQENNITKRYNGRQATTNLKP
ncbi:MAG: PilZ domain-containing protein [Candidatus Brocadiales bacterium]|nr:PilZ domain-containing protein [Candidatus Brocadiales bacterium]